MNKGQLMELIQRFIREAAVEQLKKRNRVSPLAPPDMSDDELDIVFFHGNMRDNLKESFDSAAKINASDITEFEQQMSETVANIPNAVLSFDKQRNGYSIMLKNEGTISVVASGKITFGSEGEMTWMFSIPNGFRIQTEQLQITNSNRDLISEMANYYNTWQKDWRQKLIAPDQGEGDQEGDEMADMKTPPGAPGQPGMEAGAPPEMPQQGGPQL